MADFAVFFDPDRACWLRFCAPVNTYETHNLNQVVPTLTDLEHRVETEGLYAAGFVSYEAAPAFDPALLTHDKNDFPLLRFGLFRPPEPIALNPAQEPTAPVDWHATVHANNFAEAVRRIHVAIASGETYQVNLTFPLWSQFTIDPWLFFLQMVNGQRLPGAGYLEAGRWVVCSASPELFFSLAGNRLVMRPMKGTAIRGRTLEEDQRYGKELQSSLKDQAENLMIVDMVRNDLGKIASVGSVRVETLYSLEKYCSVWQLTSTVSAVTEKRLPDIFRALFPCASITGAPKPKTMEIIAELEAKPRTLYTGCFGWFGPNRQARFNVAIRTAIIDRQKNQASYGVGAGITWDSMSSNEYQECLSKAANLKRPHPDFALLETFRWTPFKGYFLLREHLERLSSSASYFDFNYHDKHVRDYLERLAKTLGKRPQKVRLLLYADGRLESAAEPLKPIQSHDLLRVKFAAHPIDSTETFLYHKTTWRKIYTDAMHGVSNADEVLLWNRQGEATEFCKGNLVAEIDGQLLTPSLNSGLLPGTYRQHLLRSQVIFEQSLTLEDVRSSSRIFLINAVRKWQRVYFAI